MSSWTDLIVKMSIMGMVLLDPTLEMVKDGRLVIVLANCEVYRYLVVKATLATSFRASIWEGGVASALEECWNPHVKHALTLFITCRISFEDSLVIPQYLPSG